ncbi:efflux RND transporter permease subunit [Psychromonas ossibalaenae]|uniref:efflux RND transporter permease subunit n=1 Tax=Psychromonas ossibalaenae TaxID=444922 RepID=UPI000382CC3E|nr:efflux RND transporter permease subunit [Psychromonas ossibalaenae]
MNITTLALRKQQLMILLIFASLVAGVFAFLNIPQAQDPGFPIRTAQVVTTFNGASPQRVEELVTDKIETAIQEMPELEGISSQSKNGVSIISVDIQDQYKDLRPIWDSLRRKVDAVQNELPEGAGRSVVNDEYGDVFGIVISIVADDYEYKDKQEIADQVRDKFLRVPQVGKVDIYGEQAEKIYIEYDNSRLKALNITPTYIAQFLQNKNVILSGGQWETPSEVVNIEPSGNLESVDALKKTYIPLPNSSEVLPLENIAHVYRGYENPARSLVHTNGSPSLTIAISMVDGGNIIKLGEDIQAQLDEFLGVYPWGVDFEVISFQPKLVADTVDSFMSNLLQAVIVVSAVMLITLGYRTGMIVSSLIPVTIAATVAIMYWAGIGLDQVSLAALMIALGMLVDNSIVMSEGIMTRMEQGEKPFDASVNTANELKISLLTSSLTTSAAFLPIFLAESTTGEYTAPLFTVVTITLLASWFFAVTMIPMLCMLFLKVKLKKKNKSNTETEKTTLDKVENIYASLLQKVLNWRWTSLASIGLVFILALYSFRFVPVIFFPPSEAPTFKLELELPTGSPIARTQEVVSSIESYLSSLTDDGENSMGLVNWSAFIGNGGPRYVLSHSTKPASPNYSVFILNTKTGDDVEPLMKALDQHIFRNYPDVSYMTRKIENGAAIKNPIEVRIMGDDSETLLGIAGTVKQQLNSIKGVKGISDDWGLKAKTYAVQINEAEAQRLGITNSDIAVNLQASSSGLKVSDYREGEDIIPIVMQAKSRTSNYIERPTSVNMMIHDGSFVPMGAVVTPDIKWEPAVIPRRDRQKAISVAAGIDFDMTAAQVNRKLVPWLTEQAKTWPTGYRWELGGVAESSGQANKSIFEKLPIGFIIILILLMAQFNCVRKSAIILMTIPLGLIGVSFGLNVMGSYIGFMTILGIISLAGIVINNAIVLIDRIDYEKNENGYSPYYAIVEAAKRRMRPILLTTATTVVGMIPLYLGGGVMWEPMAVAIIFGLLGATVLTLGVVPLLYSILFRVNTKTA